MHLVLTDEFAALCDSLSWHESLPQTICLPLSTLGLHMSCNPRSPFRLRAWTACACGCNGCSGCIRQPGPLGLCSSIPLFNQKTWWATTWEAFFTDGTLHGGLRLDCCKANAIDGCGLLRRGGGLDSRNTLQHFWAVRIPEPGQTCSPFGVWSRAILPSMLNRLRSANSRGRAMGVLWRPCHGCEKRSSVRCRSAHRMLGSLADLTDCCLFQVSTLLYKEVPMGPAGDLVDSASGRACRHKWHKHRTTPVVFATGSDRYVVLPRASQTAACARMNRDVVSHWCRGRSPCQRPFKRCLHLHARCPK